MTDQEKLLALCEFVAHEDTCCGCGLGQMLVIDNPHIPIIRELLADNERLVEALKCYKHLHMSSYHDRNLATRDSWPIAQEALETHQATMKKLLKEQGEEK